MPTAYESYIKELRHTVTVSGLNYEIWRTYNSPETRPRYNDTMNNYLLFFSTSIHAHFVALLMSLYKLYEKRDDTYNIPGFLDQLEKDSALEKDVIESLRSQYAKVKPLWIKVCILRNKVFGHSSKAHTSEEAFKEAGVTPDELKQLMESTKVLLNQLTRKLEGSTHAFNLGAAKDTLRLLTDLQKK